MLVDVVGTLVVLVAGFAGLAAWVRRDALRRGTPFPSYDAQRPYVGH